MSRIAPWLTVVALAVFILLKIPTLPLSFFWDEIIVYAHPAQVVYEEGFSRVHPLSGRPATLFFGHPPAYASSIAFFYQVLGASPWTARFFTLLLALGGLVATYQLFKRQYGSWAGFIGLVLLASEPNYFVQSTQVLADVAVMVLIPVVLYFASSGRLFAYAVAATYLILAKETALAVIVGVPLAKLLVDRRMTRRELTAFGVPLLALALYFLNEKIFTGHFSNWPPGQNNMLRSLADYPANLFFQFKAAIWDRVGGRHLLFVAVVVAIFSSFFQGKAFRRNDGSWIFLAAVLSAVFFFMGKAFLTEINEHYFIPVLPPLVIAALGFAWRCVPAPWLVLPVVSIWLVASVQVPDYHSDAFSVGDPLEGKLNYIDVIKLQDEATEYVRTNFPGARLHAVWPVNSALTMRVAGFPENDFEVVTGGAPGPLDVLIWAEVSSAPDYEKQAELVKEQGLVADRVFERRGRKITIFIRPGLSRGRGAAGSAGAGNS